MRQCHPPRLSEGREEAERGVSAHSMAQTQTHMTKSMGRKRRLQQLLESRIAVAMSALLPTLEAARLRLPLVGAQAAGV